MPRGAVISDSCSIEGCTSPSRRRGWCNAHYQRWYRHGDPTAGEASRRIIKTRISPEARFWRKVSKTDGCWLWTGATTYYGYGEIDIDGRPYRTHRFSWELHFGPIPDGLEVCHFCDTPACVRPDHLWLGTHAENMRDMGDKGRYEVPGLRGRDQGSAKLTEDQVRAIRADPRGGPTIAREYGIDPSHVWLIRTRRSWAWLD